jgi:3'-5' exoribonuclease
MKKVFVNQLRAGQSIDDCFVLAAKSLSHKRDGNPYLNLVLSDRSGSVKGVAWDNVDQMTAAAAGDVVFVRGDVGAYRGELQVVIKSLSQQPSEHIDPTDFLPVTDKDVEGMFQRLTAITRRFQDPHLKALFELFWQDSSFVKQFKSAPAAKKMHHAYVGGLLEHTLSMVVLAGRIIGHYSGLDGDLVVAGAILHDIGKTRELDYALSFDYSDEGRLLSHIVIGLQILDEKIKDLENFPKPKADLLRHMIVSHHGSRELGSPEPPKTIEAVLLHYIDEIDSRVNAIREFISRDDGSETWSAYHRLLERHFYKGQSKSVESQ